jgi:ferredoxin
MKYLANVVSLELIAERCTGCGRCLEVCPREVFARHGTIVQIVDRDLCIECGACMMNCAFAALQRIVDRDLCIECGACMMNCAFAALQVNAGVGCASAIINGLIRGGEPECGCGDSPNSSCC